MEFTLTLLKSVSFKLANGISSQEIDEQINDTKVSELLKGYRGEAPCDIDAVKEAIKRVARLTLTSLKYPNWILTQFSYTKTDQVLLI